MKNFEAFHWIFHEAKTFFSEMFGPYPSTIRVEKLIYFLC